MIRPNLRLLELITSRQKLKQFLATPLYANAIYLMANVAILSLFGFVFWIVIARFYTEAEVGYSAAIISVISLLASLSLIGLNHSLIRFLPQAEKPNGLINSCFTLTSLISLVVAAIFVAGVGFWSPPLAFIKENAVFATVFIISTPLWALSLLISSTFVAKRRAGFVLSTNAIFALLKIILPIPLVLFFHSFGIVASWGIAIGVAVTVSLFLFLPKVLDSYKPVPTLDLDAIKSRWRYSGGSYLVSLFATAPTFILPLIVVNLLGPKTNAYFYIAWVMAGLLSAISWAVSSSLFAEGVHFEDKLRENVVKSARFTFLILIPAAILLVLFGKWILLAFGQSYSENGLRLLRILSLASLPLSITHIYTSVLRVRGRLKELITIWGLIAVTVLVTSYLIIPFTGIIGTGYAWLGAHVVVAIYILIFRRH